MLSVLSKYVIKICFNILLQTFVVDYLACLLLIGNRFLNIMRTITTLKHGSRNIKLWHHQYLGSLIETKHVVVLCHTDLFVVSSLMDFLFLEDRSSCFARSRSWRDSSESYLPATFSLSSITSRKHDSQYD